MQRPSFPTGQTRPTLSEDIGEVDGSHDAGQDGRLVTSDQPLAAYCGAQPAPAARRAGPREHGRQAARSERDRPERAREIDDELSHGRAAAGRRA